MIAIEQPRNFCCLHTPVKLRFPYRPVRAAGTVESALRWTCPGWCHKQYFPCESSLWKREHSLKSWIQQVMNKKCSCDCCLMLSKENDWMDLQHRLCLIMSMMIFKIPLPINVARKTLKYFSCMKNKAECTDFRTEEILVLRSSGLIIRFPSF